MNQPDRNEACAGRRSIRLFGVSDLPMDLLIKGTSYKLNSTHPVHAESGSLDTLLVSWALCAAMLPGFQQQP
jgi:hypothetical protein